MANFLIVHAVLVIRRWVAPIVALTPERAHVLTGAVPLDMPIDVKEVVAAVVTWIADDLC